MNDGANLTPEYVNTALAALRALPESSVMAFGADLRYVLVAGQAVSQAGLDRAEMEGRLVADVLSAERWEFWEPLYRAALRGETTSLEVEGIDSGRYYQVDLGPWEDGSGAAGGLAVARDITERKRAQWYFEGLLESAPDAMVIVNAAGEITLVNAQTEKLFGYCRDALLGERIELLIPDRFTGHHPAHRTDSFAGPQARAMGEGLELCGRRSDGSKFPIEISSSPLQTEQGRLVSSAIRDISDRKRLEGLAGHLRAVVESSADAIISKTLDGTIVSWNPGAESLYGYSEAEAIGHPISMLVPEDHQDEVPRLLARVRAGEAVGHFNTVRRRKDGSLIDVALTLSAMRDAAGQVTGASTIARDITERKRSDAALGEARADIDRFFGLSLDAMAIANDEGRFVRVNPAFERTLGYSLEELTGTPFAEFIHPDDLASTLEVYADLLAGSSAVGFENRYRANNGDYRWLVWNASAAEDGLVYCAGRDVTAHKHLEDSAREAEELLSLAFEHSPLGMHLATPERRLLRVNRAWAEMLGYTVAELLTNPDPAALTHPDDVAHDVSSLQPLLDGETDWGQWETRYVHADGHPVWGLLSVSTLRDADGTPRLLISQVQDISERKAMEQELRASEQRLALAQQAAGVGTWDWNIATGVIVWSPEMEVIYGVTHRVGSRAATRAGQRGSIRTTCRLPKRV